MDDIRFTYEYADHGYWAGIASKPERTRILMTVTFELVPVIDDSWVEGSDGTPFI